MDTMHYESFTDDRKSNIDMPDMAFQCLPTSQLALLNRTRNIFLLLTCIQFVVSIISVIVVAYAYVFNYALGFESYSTILRFLPFLSVICFGFGLFAANQYHVQGLLLFAKLLMADLIITYLSVTGFIIVPMCLKKYTINTASTIIFALSYQTIFCIVSVLPGLTVRFAYKFAKLLTDNKCLIIS